MAHPIELAAVNNRTAKQSGQSRHLRLLVFFVLARSRIRLRMDEEFKCFSCLA